MLYQRIVCFRFKPGTPEEEIQAHMLDYRRLADELEEILGYTSGRAESGDFGSPPAYDSVHTLTFRRGEDIQIYFDHPAHQEFIANHKHIWDDVLVLNAPVDMIADSPAQQPEIDEY